MARREITFITDGLEHHPAVVAWRQVERRARRPGRIEVLKPDRNGSAVFRLGGAGPAGRAVVAKRRPAGKFVHELRLYAELLPTLSIPRVGFFGSASDADHYWIFLEDAGDVRYAPELPEHRALAVEWFAGLHTGGATSAGWLPPRGIEYFRTQVQAAREGVRAGLDHAGLSPSDRTVLRAILSKLETVDQRWQQLETACTGMPETVVHGDFVPKNVRVRPTRRGAELVAFDWETAGWAIPATDLALLPGDGESSRAYHRSVVLHWPGVRREDVDRVRSVGNVLRLIHAVKWEARSFQYAWIERAMRHMGTYDHHLEEATRADVWNWA